MKANYSLPPLSAAKENKTFKIFEITTLNLQKGETMQQVAS